VAVVIGCNSLLGRAVVRALRSGRYDHLVWKEKGEEEEDEGEEEEGRMVVEAVVGLDVHGAAHRDVIGAGVEYHKGDVTRSAECRALRRRMVAAAEGGAAVAFFHIAAAGMSGAAMLDEPLCAAVNVAGSANILALFREIAAISPAAFVYTSTPNVIFTGAAALTEETPYPPLAAYVDAYGKTKRLAEEHVLAHGGVAVRPAAIYGEGEERHFPRILALMRCGAGVMAVGAANVLVEWVHADNVAHIEIVAALEALRGNADVVGHHFYISDREGPINQWDFFALMMGDADLGYPAPLFRAPTAAMMHVAAACEWLHRRLAIPPFMTRSEVAKVGVTHHFVAARDRTLAVLRTDVVVTRAEGIRRMVRYLRDDLHGKCPAAVKVACRSVPAFLASIFIILVVVVIIIVGVVSVVAAWPPRHATVQMLPSPPSSPLALAQSMCG
jgi:nucleoside-diphosphate-sugar epimerase